MRNGRDSEYIKWSCDGAKSFSEVAESLRSLAKHFEGLEQFGCIYQETDGGRVSFEIPAGLVDDYCTTYGAGEKEYILGEDLLECDECDEEIGLLEPTTNE